MKREYDGYFMQLSNATLNVYLGLINNLIIHGALENDQNIKNTIRLIKEELNTERQQTYKW